MFTDCLAVHCSNGPGTGRQECREEFAERSFADEANTGAVFFIVISEAMIAGKITYFAFHEFAERKHGFGQRILTDRV